MAEEPTPQIEAPGAWPGDSQTTSPISSRLTSYSDARATPLGERGILADNNASQHTLTQAGFEKTDAQPPSSPSRTSSIATGQKSGSDSAELAAIKAAPTQTEKNEGYLQRPSMRPKRQITEDELFRSLSYRRSRPSRQNTRHSSTLSHAETAESDDDEEREEIKKLLSRMFGKTRQESSEEEKTRHLGVVWKDLTVKGALAGAALQPTTGDIFLGLPRLIGKLLTRPRTVFAKKPLRILLDDFNGCIKPGEMLLVLGRPGAGCSTFLKVIGNQRYGFEKIEGDVTYGGSDSKTMQKKYRSEVLYNPEDDLHYATLKVKETLRFALKTRTPGKASRNEGETRSEYINEFLRVVSKLFWIEHTMDTKVGNAFIRGVSGGEKKRVSIAEAMITKASTQCWDNSTRGLDASTAREYVTSLRTLTNMTHISTAVALYQAGESLYQLFDKVLLIDQGKCCYFGPADQAAKYFENLGFERPGRWTTADFLTSVTDEHERKLREGHEDRIPRSAEQFSEAFQKSEQHKNNLSEMEDFHTATEELIEERHEHQGKETKTKNFTIPFHKQVLACTKRQFLVMVGDRQSLVGKWGGIFFQALIVGSLFYNLPQTSAGAFTRGGVLFFMLLFNALLAMAELTAAFESKPILLKHKSFSFYRPAAYAIAQTVCDIPLVFIQVLIFNVVVYFMSHLQRTPSQFFISLLIIFSVTMTMYAFFRSIGATMGSLDAATRITGVSIQALIVYTGYLIPPTKMHPWLSWLRWINPVQYAFEALLSNEFYNLELQCEAPYLVPNVPGASPQYQSCTLQGSKPGQTTVNGADYILAAYNYSHSHLWRNFGFIWAFFGFFVFLTALGMEIQKPNKGGGAVTIFKRGQAPKSAERVIENKDVNEDEESGKKEIENDLEKSHGSENPVEGMAKNESVFTFQNVNYTIPYSNDQRQLLRDVQGYVKPGKLTALMVRCHPQLFDSLLTVKGSFWCWQNHFAQCSRPKDKLWYSDWRLSCRWKSFAYFISTLIGICRTARYP
jgi:ATP-binding cassette subfamily G (WHITE) protein 2 (SNQ2)